MDTAPTIEAKPDVTTPVAEVPSVEKSKTVKPVNEEARAKAAATRTKAKLAKAMKGAKTADEVFAAVERVKNGGAAVEKDAAKPEEKSDTPEAPKGVNPAHVAAAFPVMVSLWSTVAKALDPTPWGPALNDPREVRIPTTDTDGEFAEGKIVKVDPVQLLASGTAPLAAKWFGGEGQVSPELMALGTIAIVFGPPTVSVGWALIQAKFFAPEEPAK